MQLLMQLVSLPGERVPFLIGMALLVIWLWLKNNKKFAGLFLISNLTTIFIVQFLKRLIAEPRPTGALEIGFGFPSQHTASYVLFFGLLILWTKNKLLKILGIFMILTIGISRVYLGEHWTVDVIGGYVIGFTVLWLSWWSWSRFYLQKS